MTLIMAINKYSGLSQHIFDMGALASQRRFTNIFGRQNTCTACRTFNMNDDIKKTSSRGIMSGSCPSNSCIAAAPSKADAMSESNWSKACCKLLRCTSISSTIIPPGTRAPEGNFGTSCMVLAPKERARRREAGGIHVCISDTSTHDLDHSSRNTVEIYIRLRCSSQKIPQ